MFRWLLVCGLLSPLAMAGGASRVIPGLYALTIEGVVLEKSQLCGARAPATAESWSRELARFRLANAGSLAELAGVTERLRQEGSGYGVKNDAGLPPKSLLLSQFVLMALGNAQREMAMADDNRALEICERWRKGISEGGELEKQLPRAVELAKQLAVAPVAKQE